MEAFPVRSPTRPTRRRHPWQVFVGTKTATSKDNFTKETRAPGATVAHGWSETTTRRIPRRPTPPSHFPRSRPHLLRPRPSEPSPTREAPPLTPPHPTPTAHAFGVVDILRDVLIEHLQKPFFIQHRHPQLRRLFRLRSRITPHDHIRGFFRHRF